MTQRVSGVKVDPFDEGAEILWPEPRELCRVLITKPFPGPSVAERCLETEGTAYDVHHILQSFDYSGQPEAYATLLAKYWMAGEEFINLEYDVAPWPGALEQLWACPEPFCHFPYPGLPPGRLVEGIGCTKFGQAIIDKIPNSWEDWGNVPWWDLDGAIITEIKQAGFNRHVHMPYVAHIRRPANTPPEELGAR
jgi:hypothetical protein